MPRQPRPRRLKIVRWYLNGKRVPAGTEGATATPEETETWYAKVGGVVVSLGTADEGLAWAALRKLLKERSDRDLGIRDDFTDAATLPLAAHLADFLASVADGGADKGRVDDLRWRLTNLFAEAGWRTLPQITRDSCLAALSRLAKARGLADRTRNLYLAAVKQFCRWAEEGEPPRLPRSPVKGLRKIPVVKVAHDRRSPSDAEIGTLMAYLEAPGCPTRYGMGGPTRALGYRVCMATGFRAGELRSLTRESFDLVAGTVSVAASYDKARRRVTQPLPPWLVTELKAHFAAGGGVWEGFPHWWPGKVLKKDLAAAGVPYFTRAADGRKLFFDFHSLRHWYCTFMASHPGISPKTLQELCRHRTASLTLSVYAHAKQEQLRAAVDALPAVPMAVPSGLGKGNHGGKGRAEAGTERPRPGKRKGGGKR
jgi:integrase